MKQLSDSFIKHIAESRAKELFIKEFFENCTDSWYFDEMDRFEDFEVRPGFRKPFKKEVDTYMSYLSQFKDEYYDNLFSSENAMGFYAPIINKLRDIVNIIDEAKEKSKAFECTADITLKIKQIGNYFVDKYNEELAIDNNVK
jgi:hypothetical protein